MPGVPPSIQRKLLKAFGGPAQVLASPPEAIARFAGEEVGARIARGADSRLIERALRWLEDPAHHVLALGDPRYPRMLLELADPPTVIYAVGRVELLEAEALAIVGSRNASPQGVEDAHAFARALSEEGLCIVSGLARGIDASAHRGGLEARGSSIAVMGTGADRIYPARHRELAQALARDGCIVTEFPLGTAPVSWNFPRRNRLISGLARGVLVIEAANESGSLITARQAADQGREVFAMPGSIHSPLAKGCHILIKEGAKLAECADDILLELGRAPRAAQAPVAPPEPDPLLDAMGFAPTTVDQVAQASGASAPAVGAELARLLLAGRVVALPGGWFQRVG